MGKQQQLLPIVDPQSQECERPRPGTGSLQPTPSAANPPGGCCSLHPGSRGFPGPGLAVFRSFDSCPIHKDEDIPSQGFNIKAACLAPEKARVSSSPRISPGAALASCAPDRALPSPIKAPGIAYSHRNPLPQGFAARSKPSFQRQSGSSRSRKGAPARRLILCRQQIRPASPLPDPVGGAPRGRSGEAPRAKGWAAGQGLKGASTSPLHKWGNGDWAQHWICPVSKSGFEPHLVNFHPHHLGHAGSVLSPWLDQSSALGPW